MPRSLLRQLLLIWMVIVAACVGVATMLYGLYRQTEGVRLEEARQQLGGQCARIVQRYAGASEAARRGDDGAGLAAVVVQLVLADAPGVEGGVWDLHKGFVAYAYPTYDGSDHKTDIPAAEWANIVNAAQQSVTTKQAAQYRRDGRREVLLISACPLASGSAAWTMTRVPASKADAWRPLVVGMLLIFAMVAISAIALGVLVRRWSQRLQRIQQALAADTETPHIPPTGTPELDRLGAAVNDYAQRNAQALAQTRRLAAELSRHERLAALGRMTATVAHEIRNPIATMRLALENEIARGDATPDDAAHGELMLGQIRRLDGVVESLLGMVQPIRLQLETVVVQDWLATLLEHGPLPPGTSPPRVLLPAAPLRWTLDPQQLGRAVHNLLRNAAQHADPGSEVTLQAAAVEGMLQLQVCNRGAPIAEPIAAHLFEPFVSGRADGNGLGLALVREIARAHGGHARYAHADGLTHFILELPWRAS
ncbi:two-component sensor histidine kinase [Xanthomonas citri pv. citri]|uniref:Signal transduction histidine-protein kinase/phosphatase MprB n=3 Tax=Xanthomonas citri TaxID=346 RepID=A0AAI7ZCJ0_XANAC|nr:MULTISPECIES: HAMP domain-containing sensor histidine kinase [Xanthomonas]AAM35117.1 two-component system sensor protein [Xanthomonas citri pv. citri str. 306]AGH75766.1 two-component system sensor protein [Xanthomonas axonopodis Xac29-1]AGI06441.1 Signal transduction histidine kinase [Xanthomonas citri subsp. citri Aw12879]AJD66814.1 signal transduction histidine kinase [Xanthomonas citri subsp. citri A306]AJY80349.1 Signal transduction histidine kinase [Xanthomonas citri pv. citri]